LKLKSVFMIEYALKYLYRVFHLIDNTVDQLYEILIKKQILFYLWFLFHLLLHLRENEKRDILEVYLFKI